MMLTQQKCTIKKFELSKIGFFFFFFDERVKLLINQCMDTIKIKVIRKILFNSVIHTTKILQGQKLKLSLIEF